MKRPPLKFPEAGRTVVGSFGDIASLAAANPGSLSDQCDLAEIRLDLFHREFASAGPALWEHLSLFPLLFTARCHAEGSPHDIETAVRAEMLTAALGDASLVDIEVRSIPAMRQMISKLEEMGTPWIASFHDFAKLPSRAVLDEKARIARDAGAAAFKCAARLHTPCDLAALAEFQMSDAGIPLATMGMGSLAPVSRLLCAQAGSVLNYGYVGMTETAPGQWSAEKLRGCIRSLSPLI